jgi:hypothetical protein
MAGTNGVPRSDGEQTYYTPDPDKYSDLIVPGVPRLGRGSGRWNVWYINGMNTDGQAHQVAARQLATIVGKRVLGIYNQTGISGEASMLSFMVDLKQCAQDYMLPVGRAMPRIGQKLITLGRKIAGPQIGRSLLAHNLAGEKLFTKLLSAWRQKENTILVCHSQGNLITANALWVLMRVLAPSPIGNVRVFGLASPSPSWPHPTKSGLKVNLYVEKGDPVPLLRYGGKMTGAGAPHTAVRDGGEAGLDAHAVDLYMTRKDFQRDLMSALRS